MKSCAFWGPVFIEIEEYRERLLQILTDLIENQGVTQFYSDNFGEFNEYCSKLVYELKSKYPHIRKTFVISYIPLVKISFKHIFALPKYFDSAVCLFKRAVPYRQVATEVGKRLADTADYVVTFVILPSGSVYKTCKYALRKKKSICNVFDLWNIFDECNY